VFMKTDNHIGGKYFAKLIKGRASSKYIHTGNHRHIPN
jgi:hypothetical protein